VSVGKRPFLPFLSPYYPYLHARVARVPDDGKALYIIRHFRQGLFDLWRGGRKKGISQWGMEGGIRSSLLLVARARARGNERGKG